MARPDLIVMGDAQMDIAVGPVSSLALRGEIQARIGEEERAFPQALLLAGRIAGRRLTFAHGFAESPGGSADNVAFAAAKLGTKSKVICSLGDDEFGSAILNSLRQVGVDTSEAKIHSDTATGVSVLVRTEAGGRASVYFPGANARLSAEDLPEDSLKGAKAFCLTNFFLLPGINGDGLQEILQRAKDNGLMTFFDPGPIPFHSTDEEIRTILPALPFVDYFLPTEDEAKIISEESDPEVSVNAFLESGAKRVIVKLGAQGCLLTETRRGVVKVEGAKPDSVVDTTGAGDVFAAAFISRLLEGEDVLSSAKFANSAAAIACTAQGRKAFPTSQKVFELLFNSGRGTL